MTFKQMSTISQDAFALMKMAAHEHDLGVGLAQEMDELAERLREQDDEELDEDDDSKDSNYWLDRARDYVDAQPHDTCGDPEVAYAFETYSPQLERLTGLGWDMDDINLLLAQYRNNSTSERKFGIVFAKLVRKIVERLIY